MQAPPARDGVWAPIRNEFVVGISNPKAMLLFAALLPQFVSGEGPDTAARFGMLGADYLAVESVVDLAASARVPRSGRSRSPRGCTGGSCGCGVCFLGLAGLLAVDEVGP
jgi:threonine/homoserine/homoserine lactone efflux protein